MESITERDACFLIVLNASEESTLLELKWDLENWDHRSIDIVQILGELIEDGIVLFTDRDGDTYRDFSIFDSREIAKAWNNADSMNIVLFLTETGMLQWQTNDWGITSERARYLMFSNQNKDSRVK